MAIVKLADLEGGLVRFAARRQFKLQLFIDAIWPHTIKRVVIA